MQFARSFQSRIAGLGWCSLRHFRSIYWQGSCVISVHPKTMFLDVILRSNATKNLMVSAAAEILRSAQNDTREFPDGH